MALEGSQGGASCNVDESRREVLASDEEQRLLKSDVDEPRRSGNEIVQMSDLSSSLDKYKQKLTTTMIVQLNGRSRSLEGVVVLELWGVWIQGGQCKWKLKAYVYQ